MRTSNPPKFQVLPAIAGSQVEFGRQRTSMDLIKNAKALEAIFGRWPSFHDAEVVSVTVTRECADGPVLETVVHVREATSNVDGRGYFVLTNHTLVMFRFTGVREDLAIRGFNAQNVISCLDITGDTSEAGALRVEMPSIHGVDIAFTCRTAEIVAAQPCSPDCAVT